MKKEAKKPIKKTAARTKASSFFVETRRCHFHKRDHDKDGRMLALSGGEVFVQISLRGIQFDPEETKAVRIAGRWFFNVGADTALAEDCDRKWKLKL